MAGVKGRSGRRPVPSALKVLRGTDQRCRMSPTEPQPERGMPEPPPELDRTQRREWRQVAARLDSIGVLTVADGGLLANLVIASVRVRRATRHVNREGAVVAGTDGVLRRNPWAAELHAAQDLYRRLSVEFGLTPSSRTNISAAKAAAPAAEHSYRSAARERFFGDAGGDA
jgi:P27 family predicted phage terminase small subunit